MRTFLLGTNPTLLELYRFGGAVTVVGLIVGLLAIEIGAIYYISQFSITRRNRS